MVADGMGGHQAGEVASRMAVEIVSQHLRTRWDEGIPHRQAFVLALQEAVVQANAHIYQASQKHETCRGMGTTLTAAGMYDGAVFFAQVGDSRGYIIRANALTQMTRDQSLGAKLATESNPHSGYTRRQQFQHVLLQALGPEPQITAAVSFTDLCRGDWLLLCSDGLTNMVTHEEIENLVSQTPDPQVVSQALLAAANKHGGHDNITVITARCDGAGLPPPGSKAKPRPQEFVPRAWWRRFLPWHYRSERE
jgi:protein phosphatase